MPAYRRWTRAVVRTLSPGTPSARSSSRVWPDSRAHRSRTSGSDSSLSSVSTACSRIAVASATPMPYAESTPASGGTSTVPMPRASATAHACWPPAPPKLVSA